MGRYEYDPDYCSPPGDTLKEIIEYSNSSLEELSKLSGISICNLQDIIDNKLEINRDIAKKLQNVFHISETFWLNRQHNYNKIMGVKNEQI